MVGDSLLTWLSANVLKTTPPVTADHSCHDHNRGRAHCDSCSILAHRPVSIRPRCQISTLLQAVHDVCSLAFPCETQLLSLSLPVVSTVFFCFLCSPCRLPTLSDCGALARPESNSPREFATSSPAIRFLSSIFEPERCASRELNPSCVKHSSLDQDDQAVPVALLFWLG